MLDKEQQDQRSDWIAQRMAELPDDVRALLGTVLEPGEYPAAFFYADILPDDGFGERWNFLTNRRYL